MRNSDYLEVGRTRYANFGVSNLGRQRKEWALRYRRCVFCEGVLSGKQRYYCSAQCAVDFARDARYHRGFLDWNHLRYEILRRDKTCRMCDGVAEEVDHIIAVSKGGDEFDPSNLQALCHNCHVEKTVESGDKKQHKEHPQFIFTPPITLMNYMV